LDGISFDQLPARSVHSVMPLESRLAAIEEIEAPPRYRVHQLTVGHNRVAVG
jgi:hypothetical protein